MSEVNRNNVVLNLVEKKRERDGKDFKAGDIYYALEDCQVIREKKVNEKGEAVEGDVVEDPTIINLINHAKHIGLDRACTLLTQFHNTYGQLCSKEAANSEGIIDFDKVLKFHQERSTRTESKAELVQLHNALVNEVSKTINEMTDKSPAEVLELVTKCQELNKQIIELKDAIARKGRVRKSADGTIEEESEEAEAVPA